MTADVVAFLRAALDEVERVAQLALRTVTGPWEVEPFVSTSPDAVPAATWVSSGDEGVAQVRGDHIAAHIALHDPRSALARAQAERHLLAVYDWLTSGRPGLPDKEALYTSILDGISDVVEAERDLELALLWLAHGHRHAIPGWREEWAPEGVEVGA